VLDRSEFLKLGAGIVLQAYLPDSWTAQQALVEWSRRRVGRGGAPIKIRIVKGANLAMETVEAQLHGWNRAPYATKAETDANYCRMVEWGCRRESAASGAAWALPSHNLLDVWLLAFGCCAKKNGVSDCVEIEMLEVWPTSSGARGCAMRPMALLPLCARWVDSDAFSSKRSLVSGSTAR